MALTRNLIVLDTECTGLDPERHEVWELAAVVRAPGGEELDFHRFLKLSDLENADPRALEVGGFTERYVESEAVAPNEAVEELLEVTDQGVLAGLNPTFDVSFLRPLLGLRPANWHYSPLDIKSMAAGALGEEPLWSTHDLARALGVYPENFTRHSALDDCRFALAIYDAALAHINTKEAD